MVERKTTNKKTPKKKVQNPKKSAVSGARKEQIRLVVGFTLLALSIYLIFAFGSFLLNAEADQSKLQINWLKLIKDSSIQVENITGKTGAWIADVFINRWFGISSFLFIYLLILFGFRFLNRNVKSLLSKIIRTLIIILWVSVALGFAFGNKYSLMSVYPGGSYGYHLSLWLNAMVGKIGTFFILLITLLTYLVFGTKGFVKLFKPSSKKEKNPEGSELSEETILKPEKVALKDDDEVLIDEEIEEEKPLTVELEDEGIIRNNIETELVPKEETKPTESIKVIKESDKDNLEMTVEIKEETEEEVKNHPLEDYDPTLDLSHYTYPTIELLEEYSHLKTEVSDDELIENKNKIVETLRNFKIEIIKIKATIGPTVTLYEIVPAQGIRISKIKNLEDDIALSLSALGIRIIAPIPGRGTIGIEVPNRNPQMVSMRSIIASKKFQESEADLPVAMGRTISNETYVFDLAKMPHLLVAGATGQGKSVGLNAIIASLLFKKHPSQLKFVFVDPKKVELNLYSVIENHFLAKLPDAEEPIITDVEKVKATLNSVGIEMDNRYDLLKTAHSRNIKEYNKNFIGRRLNPEKGHRFLPYIVVVVDEFADLIMTAGKEVELPIARIAQLARAVGIHMIIATQRPSANIITGIIKANFPSRIAFKVASAIDSRTILDQSGANQLIGKGDMLISEGGELVRLQCAFVDTPEVEGICEHIANQQGYPTAFLLPEYVGDESEMPGAVDLKNRDDFFNDAARIVVLNQQGSTSMIQRKFSIGYNRAGRIMDQLEAAGIVGPSEGSKARRVLISDEYSLEQLLNSI
ncbi:MAG: DNA translocase FtsK [Prolixibacteraceae bacterium]|jgi:S-DNA-T family DNA segregation ATPase FtsK/SpoIIIE|nr:DNA translocase FtsK [Prolixibacteraceae bacterium]